ncbi:unannotated protein [freshwater metagenome]|uniref:Unannotated protein n=1 Tax=freshwater metagenome TaxID=449393 RepID=A0A6J7A5M3_9ZZZZ
MRTQLDDLRSKDLLPAVVSETPISTVPVTTIPGAEGETTVPTSAAPTSAAPDTTSSTTSTTLAKPKIRPLRLGTRGTLVRILQRALADQGYPVRETGYFGLITQRYVKVFQRSQKLPVSGIAGMRTWAALGY